MGTIWIDVVDVQSYSTAKPDNSEYPCTETALKDWSTAAMEHSNIPSSFTNFHPNFPMVLKPGHMYFRWFVAHFIISLSLELV